MNIKCSIYAVEQLKSANISLWVIMAETKKFVSGNSSFLNSGGLKAGATGSI